MDLFLELSTDPEDIGYGDDFTSANESGLLSKINARNIAVNKSAATADIFDCLSLDGTWGNILNAANDSQHPSYLVALQAVVMIKECNTFTRKADLKSPAGQALLTGLVQAELITSEQRAALEALNQELVSRAEQLNGKLASEIDVRKALWNDDGTRRAE